MLSFVNDYSELAHEKILKRMLALGKEANSGYGTDRYTAAAIEKIRKACGKPEAPVCLIAGGTQTNLTVISGILKTYQGVVAAATGHVAVHEGGAIEATGHKVIALPGREGKLMPEVLGTYLKGFYEDASCEHMVQPGMVYISFPTEYGTLYSKNELKALHDLCKEYKMPLFIDGARLGYGLMCEEADVTIRDIADLCDVFYIGGTKVGALLGEAVVFSGMQMPEHFITHLKQRGALLAKGFVTGLQFDTLFTDDLYFEISRNAVRLACKLREALKEKGYAFLIDSPSNQTFIVLEDGKLPELAEKVRYDRWERVDERHTAIRLATSWATEEKDVEELIACL